MKNEKPSLPQNDSDHRSMITKVRGGWTKDKIKKELNKKSASQTELLFQKEISKYDTPKEFSDNLFYHGSGRHISYLKPSVVLKNSEHFGGGHEEQFYGISLSKDREIASNFTGNSSSGNVASVLLKRGTIIKKLPNISDANELDDIIEDLWTEGVDAVLIGDHEHSHSEKELVVLNPRCAIVGKPESFPVFHKPKMPSFDQEKLIEIWTDSSKLYKKMSLESWDNSNISFKEKHGRDKDINTRWTSRQQLYVDYHEYNVKLLDNNDISQDIKSFLKEADQKKSKKQTKLSFNL
jgi:hypothetical protein